jgi:hypothetical protein
MPTEFDSIFATLRAILRKHRGALHVATDTPVCYSLEGKPGPAAIQAWGGEMKKPMMPVAWVQIGKAYVSFHLMPIYGYPALCDGMSKGLQARMQGKSCFNFKSEDKAVFQELEELTVRSISAFKKAGFVADEPTA